MGAVLTLGCDMIPKINFAMQQNYIPFIRNLTVGNEGDEDISDVRLTIAFDPAFAKTFTYDISCVPSGKSVEISPLRIILSTEMLFSLTEAVSGTVSFSLSKDEKELYQKDIPVQLLAFNEWSGLAFDPELIAAPLFCFHLSALSHLFLSFIFFLVAHYTFQKHYTTL